YLSIFYLLTPILFVLIIPRPPSSTLFPYTTLFRSRSYRSRQRRPYTRVLRLVHHSRHHHERTAVVAHRSKRLFPRSFCSFDGKDFISTRLGYLPMPASVDAGIMCCSPEGAGCESTFDQIRLTH